MAADTTIDLAGLPAIQRPVLLGTAGIAAFLCASLWLDSPMMAGVLVIGLGLGVALYHAGFGFTAAYRRALLEKDLSGIIAQAIMLIVASSLFAPLLSAGEIFGHGVGGAIAPVGVAMLIGAFVFGIGMQLGGACASGTLFTVGGGNLRMVVTLVFFCAGSWWGTLDLPWWRSLPALPPLALGTVVGWGPAVLLQAAVLGLIVWVLHRLGGRARAPLWWNGRFSRDAVLRGPWPLLLGGLALAVLNTAMLALTGSPWGVTWGFTLWGAKTAVALGWDPSGSAFWSEEWTRIALDQSILSSTTSVSDIGILIGAGIAEYNFWSPADKATGKTERVGKLVQSNVVPFAEKMTFLEDNQAVVSGITSVDADGHTPGHMAFHVESEGKRLMITADTANHYVMSLQRPDWEVSFDMNKKKAAESRKEIFGMIAADKIPFTGYHMPFPNVGYVEPMGSGFRYVPAGYHLDLG
ncbi:YeeE/YedE [alpha proteobacterium BAL199]|nr:YeeE/YedE [alpha proteobacterium BAL199]